MKSLFYFFLALTLFSCSQPTASNSLYKKEIVDLDQTFATMDSNYQLFESAKVDTLKLIRDSANKKYNRIKSVYQSDFIDTKFEEIMLIARGQLVKKLAKIEGNSSKIENEYSYSTKQYRNLRENLIHETLEKEESLIFFSEEKNALILLNAEIVNFNESIQNTLSIATTILPQLDSIIDVHEPKPE